MPYFLRLIVVFVGYIASLGIRVSPPAKRTALSMDVADINNIVVDSNVLLRGVRVGKVTRIDTSVAAATIHFYIDGQYQVPVDSDVRLENLSALGESYIELEPRSSGGPILRDGQRIAAGIGETATLDIRAWSQRCACPQPDLTPTSSVVLLARLTRGFRTRVLCCPTWRMRAYYFVTRPPISKVQGRELARQFPGAAAKRRLCRARTR